jgi:hypothetical protein
MLANNSRSYPNEAPIRSLPLGRLLTLNGNIRLGWKSLPGANTLSYLANWKVTKKIKCCEYGHWCRNIWSTGSFVKLSAARYECYAHYKGKYAVSGNMYYRKLDFHIEKNLKLASHRMPFWQNDWLAK